MTYRGHVKNGVVVLEHGSALPEGAAVEVATIDKPSAHTSLPEKLRRLAGRARGLPRDMARNHDHYLHGTPRA